MLFSGAVLAAVLAPWTPVQIEGTKVGVWGRSYDFVSNALPVSVTSQGREFLTGPMRLEGTDATHAPLVWTKGGSWVQESSDEEAVLCAWQSAPAAAADASVRIAADGMVKVALTLVPGPEKNCGTLNRLWLEIPLKRDVAKLFNYSPASWTKFQNVGTVTNDIVWPFRPVVWLGDEKVDFSCF